MKGLQQLGVIKWKGVDMLSGMRWLRACCHRNVVVEVHIAGKAIKEGTVDSILYGSQQLPMRRACSVSMI